MGKKKAKPPYVGTLYLVQEKVLESLNEELAEFMEEMDDEDLEEIDRAEGWKPVKAFVNRAAADAHRLELETRRRTRENPFTNGSGIDDWSHFEPPQFHDWLMDADLEPPKGTKKKPVPVSDWREWWDTNAKTMTALQRAKVWEACSKVTYYEVVELSS